MSGKEEKNTQAESNKLTDEELENVSGGATVVSKRDNLSDDGVTKPDLKSALKN